MWWNFIFIFIFIIIFVITIYLTRRNDTRLILSVMVLLIIGFYLIAIFSEHRIGDCSNPFAWIYILLIFTFIIFLILNIFIQKDKRVCGGCNGTSAYRLLMASFAIIIFFSIIVGCSILFIASR